MDAIRPCPLSTDNTRVFPYGATEPLKLMGHFYANLTYGNNRKIAKILVVPGRGGCLLGRKTAVDLGLLNLNYINQLRADAGVRTAIRNILSEYDDIFLVWGS